MPRSLTWTYRIKDTLGLFQKRKYIPWTREPFPSGKQESPKSDFDDEAPFTIPCSLCMCLLFVCVCLGSASSRNEVLRKQVRHGVISLSPHSVLPQRKTSRRERENIDRMLLNVEAGSGSQSLLSSLLTSFCLLFLFLTLYRLVGFSVLYRCSSSLLSSFRLPFWEGEPLLPPSLSLSLFQRSSFLSVYFGYFEFPFLLPSSLCLSPRFVDILRESLISCWTYKDTHWLVSLTLFLSLSCYTTPVAQ